MTEKTSETKNWFFKKFNKIDKPLAKLPKEKGRKTQITKIRNESEDTVSDFTEIKKEL